MNVAVAGEISAPELMRLVGIDGDRLQKMLIDECVKEMDRYVPMKTGMLKNTRQIEKDGVTYVGKYARYVYYGTLMVSPSGSAWAKAGERKHLTHTPLTYRGAPTRGAFWDVRMWADKRDSIVRRISQICGGRPM